MLVPHLAALSRAAEPFAGGGGWQSQVPQSGPPKVKPSPGPGLTLASCEQLHMPVAMG